MSVHDSKIAGSEADVDVNGRDAPVTPTDADEAAEFEAFLNSAPMPDPETLRALSKAHLEFLDELDEKLGPVPPEIQEQARRLYNELRANADL